MIYSTDEKFRLRLVDKPDLEFITELRTGPTVQEYAGTPLITNNTTQIKWLESLQNDSRNMYMILEHNKIPIGEVRINFIDYPNRHMFVGGDIKAEYRGKGYGKEMYKLIFKLGFDILGMNRLWLLVSETNKRAIGLYQKMGFSHEGVQRKALFKNGVYLDYLMMGILASEYYTNKEKLI